MQSGMIILMADMVENRDDNTGGHIKRTARYVEGIAREGLREYGYLTMAVEMAAYHHEWWDGSGYPYGLSGNDIPFYARIMAVADVFDALITKRVYKDAVPLEKAYAIIREEFGTHFEPELIEAFLGIVDDIIIKD